MEIFLDISPIIVVLLAFLVIFMGKKGAIMATISFIFYFGAIFIAAL